MFQNQLVQIVADAINLYERMANDNVVFQSPSLSEKEQVEKRMMHWLETVAEGNQDKFQKRLHWEDWDHKKIRLILGPLALKNKHLLPTWGIFLGKIIQNARIISGDELAELPIDPANPLPYEEILLFVVLIARQELFAKLNIDIANPSIPYVSLAAYKNLERTLLRRLCSLCEHTFELEFSKIRPMEKVFSAQLFESLGLSPESAVEQVSRVYYEKFVQQLLQSENLLGFFRLYPVLGRIIATTVLFWIETTFEFINRLVTDYPVLQETFAFEDQPLGKVIALENSKSDLHCRGRTVVILTFENNQKLVYKPRDAKLSVIYNQFLTWCNQQTIPLLFKVLKVLDRDGYSWEEFLVWQPSKSEEAIKRFYERAGMLLCVLHLLGATDCHGENLVAHGEHLVLIDSETLLTPTPANFETNILEDTVLRTGLLPSWQLTVGGGTFDYGGLGCAPAEQSMLFEKNWNFINTDLMYYKNEQSETLKLPNILMLEGKPISPRDYLAEITKGFKWMYHFFLNKRAEILLQLEKFQNCQVRYVPRPTATYYALLANSFYVKNLTNGIDRSIEIELLARSHLDSQRTSKHWPILLEEALQLEQMDIPYFITHSSTTMLSTKEKPNLVSDFFEETSFNLIRIRLQNLSESDLILQTKLISSSFYVQAMRPHQDDRKLISQADSSSSEINVKNLLAKVQSIAEEIAANLLRDSKQRINWIAPTYNPRTDRFDLQALDTNIYDGSLGIALFLVAFAHVTHQSSYSDIALNVIKPLRDGLNSANPKTQQKILKLGLGGLTGMGSLIYTLVQMSRMLALKELTVDALQVANLITSEQIFADKNLDVISGVAGTILGLLTLYAETEDSAILKKAITCGEYLISKQQEISNGCKTWLTITPQPLTGFSHGAAGIAYALLRLYKVTQKKEFLNAAEDGIKFERAVFSTKENNWPDFRKMTKQEDEAKDFSVSWCHGAAGITLARIGGLDVLRTPEIEAEIRIGLQTTQQYKGNKDHLCCGNFGRMETLWVAANKLPDSALKNYVLNNVNQNLMTGQKDNFSTFPIPVFNPSFFLGTAGVGYQLLRLVYPEKLPSVLLLEN